MDAIKRPAFNVLIMSESSRLGREAWETGYALKRLLKAGVRVFLYLEDRECTVDNPTDKLMFSVLQGVDEMHRALASQRSIDKALQLARAGHVTGGRTFGYDNVRQASHTERRINDDEAAVVRRIFELAAAGVGQKRIAQLLNEERRRRLERSRIGRPRGPIPRCTKSSSASCIAASIVWNRTRKRNRWGEKERTDRPEQRLAQGGRAAAAHRRRGTLVGRSRADCCVATAPSVRRSGRPKTRRAAVPPDGFCALQLLQRRPARPVAAGRQSWQSRAAPGSTRAPRTSTVAVRCARMIFEFASRPSTRRLWRASARS